MLFNTYRKKLIILFLSIAVIPIILFGISISTRINKQIISEYKQIKTSALINEAERLDAWVKLNEEELKDIAENYYSINSIETEESLETDESVETKESVDIDKKTTKEITEYLSSYVISTQEIKRAYITLQNGAEYSSDGKTFRHDTRLSEWYLNTTLNKDITWTVLNSYERLIVTASIPLFDENKEIEGVLAVDFDFTAKLAEIDYMNIDEDAVTYIVDDSNNILKTFHNESFLEEKDKELSNEIETRYSYFRTEPSGNMIIEGDSKYVVFHSTLPSTNWKIISFLDSDDFYSKIVISSTYIVGITGITFILVIIMAIIFSKSFSVPLEKLKDGAIEIQNGNYEYRIDVKTNDEFGKVAEVFNDMILKLKESYAKLHANNEELIKNNLQLQNMNMELESSYQQLKATTDQLDESELKYRTLIENMNDLFWLTDSDLNVVYVNDQIENILKFSKEDILGRNLRKLSHLLYDYNGNLMEDIQNEDHKNKEFIMKDKDGNQIIIEMTTKRIYERDCFIGVQGVIRDMTERKSMEKDIYTRNRELSVINKMSRSINLTSDINNLLQTATDEIFKLLRTSLCTIRLVDNDVLKLMAMSGEIVDVEIYEEIPINDSVVREVVLTGEPLISNERTCQLKINYTQSDVEVDKVAHNNIFPIKSRGKVLGVLSIDGAKPLNKFEINIINSITNQIAVKIENIKLYNGLKENYIKTIETLAAAIEAKDNYTEGHSSRVAKYSLMISQSLGLSPKYCEDIEIAGILHDVGKIGISDTILSKPGRLTESEFEMIAQHPMIGSKILEGIGLSEVIMNAIKLHHKRYDLKGYPNEIELDELPLEACIVGVADAFDAMTSNRSYREAITLDNAIDELIKNKGTQFHPYIVDIVYDIYKNTPEKITEIIEYKSMVS